MREVQTTDLRLKLIIQKLQKGLNQDHIQDQDPRNQSFQILQRSLASPRAAPSIKERKILRLQMIKFFSKMHPNQVFQFRKVSLIM